MALTQNQSPAVFPIDSVIPLESILCTEDLHRRPPHPPDNETENRALSALVQALANSPHTILQTLADKILEVLRCGSAGISLLTTHDGGKRFYWPAIAGVWKPHIGGGTPRDFGPCGDVLDRNASLLFRHLERRYTYFLPVTPPVEECLLIPFYVEGKAVGTIWAVAHDDHRKFDTEDLRQLESLGRFASAAYQAVTLLDALEQRSEALRQSHIELAQRVAELQQVNMAAQQFASIVESSNDAIVSKDLNGMIVSWNQGAERLFGYSADEIVGKPVTTLIPPEREDEEPTILERIRRGERVNHYETVRQRKDGSRIHISLSVSPIKDAVGRVVGASKIARDISELRRAQEQQALLLREMSHRVKNLFTVAGGMVALSARSARTPAEMVNSVHGRLTALARAHELTRPGLIETDVRGSQDTTLHAIAQTIFSPYVDLERAQDCVSISGPDVPIGRNAITNFALVLHELTTNAAKYGALSTPTGHVQIDCSANGGELLLTWKENGGPRLDGEPEREGFGGQLTRQIVTSQFGGEVSFEWNPDGLTVHLSARLERLAA